MKAISPVIATVIIVAVAIAISIAVALWMTGITSSFTGLEKLEVVNAYATKESNKWDVYVLVKNTGTKTATVDQIFINNQPYPTGSISYTTANSPPDTDSANIGFSDGVPIDTGHYALFKIELDGTKYTSGQTVSIVIHTASGGQYPATVTLP